MSSYPRKLPLSFYATQTEIVKQFLIVTVSSLIVVKSQVKYQLVVFVTQLTMDFCRSISFDEKQVEYDVKLFSSYRVLHHFTYMEIWWSVFYQVEMNSVIFEAWKVMNAYYSWIQISNPSSYYVKLKIS